MAFLRIWEGQSMKHYLDLVPISEKVHRRQNMMSIFCIVLAVFLVTTIFGMADMYIRSQILQTQLDSGNFHISVRDITDEDAALIAMRPDVKAASRYGVLNYRGEDGYTIFGKNSIIVGCDEPLVTELLVDQITEGKFPQTDTQAMITENAKEWKLLYAANLCHCRRFVFTGHGCRHYDDCQQPEQQCSLAHQVFRHDALYWRNAQAGYAVSP